jgi:galactofuranosylgalactofuranosylrhamnosyl-N-acetylglucosaminyl-diphospho-decaprenol beta-1,5/1,6-galactofuranosyltransferase
VLPEQAVLPPAKGRPRWLVSLARSLVDSALRPTVPGAPPRRLLAADFGWSRLGRADAIAVETWWDREMPVFRRSREDFRAIVRAAIPALRRLYQDGPTISRRWREAFPRQSSTAFWRNYLGIATEAKPEAVVAPAPLKPGLRSAASVRPVGGRMAAGAMARVSHPET